MRNNSSHTARRPRRLPPRRVFAGVAAAGLVSPLLWAMPLHGQEDPLPRPTPVPLPTRRPTPSPGVTPVPIRTGTVQTLEGIIVGRPGRTDFAFRANGNVYRVTPYAPALLQQIQGGDLARVHGLVDGLLISGANVRTLRSRASNSPDDYGPAVVPDTTRSGR